MKKLLSILLILITAFAASAQTDGTSTISVVAPASGLGSIADKEHVIMGSTSTFTLDLTDGGLGGVSLRTLVMGGKVISMKQGTNSYTLTDISAGLNVKHYYTSLLSALDPIIIEVQWETIGEGYLAFRQEAELACFNDAYSIYYTHVMAKDSYMISISPEFTTACSGSNAVLNFKLTANQELLTTDEVFIRLQQFGQTAVAEMDYIIKLTSSNVSFSGSTPPGLEVDSFVRNGKNYTFNLNISTDSNVSTQVEKGILLHTDTYIKRIDGRINLNDSNDGIFSLLGDGDYGYTILPLPATNPVLNDVLAETGLEVIGGTYQYKVTNWNSGNRYVWSIKTKLGAIVPNAHVEFMYSNEKATAKFKVKGEYVVSVIETANGGCSGSVNDLEVIIEDFNLTGEVRDYIEDICSNDTNGASIFKIVYPKTDGLIIDGSTCDVIIGGQTISLAGASINATEFAFELSFKNLSDNGINYIPTNSTPIAFTPEITNIRDGNNVKIGNDINTLAEFRVNNSPAEGVVKHRVNIPGENIWIPSNYTRVTGDLSTMNGHSVYVGGKTKYNFVADKTRTITWDVVNATNTSVVGQACTISTDYQNNGGWYVVTVTWLDAAAGNDYYIAATEKITNGCSTVSKYGPVSVLANNFTAELSVHGYTTNTIPIVDLNDQVKIPCVSLEEVEINGVLSYKTVVNYNLSVSGAINPWEYKFMIGIKYDYSTSVVDKYGVTNTISQQAKIEGSNSIEFVEPSDSEMVDMSGDWATQAGTQTQTTATINRALDIEKGVGYAYVWIWVKEIKDRYGTIISNPNEMKRVAIIKQLPDTSEISIN